MAKHLRDTIRFITLLLRSDWDKTMPARTPAEPAQAAPGVPGRVWPDASWRSGRRDACAGWRTRKEAPAALEAALRSSTWNSKKLISPAPKHDY